MATTLSEKIRLLKEEIRRIESLSRGTNRHCPIVVVSYLHGIDGNGYELPQCDLRDLRGRTGCGVWHL